ncbi:MAG: AAA family ATPase [Microcystaceae cyanobacterium]
MDSIRLQHLRCLTDTGEIALKPMTILLGQNSSGKSTFLRFFPLLKQSVEARTSGPILWYGRLVDFGTYQEAKQKGLDEDIIFSFKFKYLFFWTPDKEPEDVYIELCLSENSSKQLTIARYLILKIDDKKIQINFDENQQIESFIINNINFLNLDNEELIKSEELFKTDYFFTIRQFYLANTNLVADDNAQRMKNSNVFKIHKNSLSKLPEILPLIDLSELSQNQKDFFLNYISIPILELITHIDRRLSRLAQNVKYFEPARDTAQRYYRTQDLAVDEIDPKGQNLAMFLRNLKEEELKKFQEWTLSNFGFELIITSSMSLISLNIKPKDSKDYYNIADTGFGFSQILPIITQLWFTTKLLQSKTRSDNSNVNLESPVIFAIEQPELHLHPRLQGILTDVLVNSIKVAKENEIDLRLVIETHSKVLVNRLGQLIDKGTISSDDINLVLFEPSDDPQKVNVRTTQFNESGFIDNWPLGFLDMDLDLDVD